MCLSPVSASASMRRTLSATGIIFFSDWKPSRGPSSEMVTRLGRSDIDYSFDWLLEGGSALFLERFLARLAQARQGHEDQQAEADRPLQEHHRVAAREQHGAPEIFLHLRPEH